MVTEWSGVKLGDNQENMEYCALSSSFFFPFSYPSAYPGSFNTIF